MPKFKEWITEKLGYEPRIIDLARDLGEERGELVRKWFVGESYPNKTSISRISVLLKMSINDVKKEILRIQMEDMDT